AGIAEIAGAIVLPIVVIVAIAVRGDVIAEKRRGPWAVRPADGYISLLLIVGPESSIDASRNRFADSILRHDVDDAADRTIAIEHDTAVAARDFDTLDALARDGGEVDADKVEIRDPPPVDQNERVGRRGRTKPTHVDHAAGAIHA